MRSERHRIPLAMQMRGVGWCQIERQIRPTSSKAWGPGSLAGAELHQLGPGVALHPDDLPDIGLIELVL